MGERLAAVLDHVAVAVPDLATAEGRWVDELGGAPLGLFAWEGNPFQSRQYRYANGARLELITSSPGAQDSFVDAFLERFGTRVHHVTLKVDDHDGAIAILQGAGYDVVDILRYEGVWYEAFLRPSQVGGVIVQIAMDPRQHRMPEPRPHAAEFVGVRVRHPDLDRARELWRLLGARIDDTAGGLRCTWPSSPACVELVEGEPAGPGELLFAGAGVTDLLPVDGVGPRVEAVSPQTGG